MTGCVCQVPPCQVLVAAPEEDRPTATQSPAAGHAIDDTDVMPGGGAVDDHDIAPLLLERNWTGSPVVPVRLVPTAQHADAVAHVTLSTPDVPDGTASRFQVLPPSVDTSAVAPADGSEVPTGFEPMATHTSAEVQAMDSSAPASPLTVPCCHDSPASLLVNMVAPTAMQRVDVGHATDPTPRDPGGTDAALQVIPPSFETMMLPMYGPASLGDTPTATHNRLLRQVTSSSVVSGIGRACIDQDSPAFVVVSAASDPTATQSSVLAQATASSSGAWLGTTCEVQVAPPFALTAATPDPLALAPTAMQDDTVGQATASKPPTPGNAPPGVDTAGAPMLVGAIDGTDVVGAAPGVDDEVALVRAS